MATITPKEKDGKIIAYKFRACVGRDENGRQTQWETVVILVIHQNPSFFAQRHRLNPLRQLGLACG